ncbi:MAG: Tol-Pal system protein TolB, partial [Sedimenticola sp.]|nr:Tol-Pal system protein TolB [Sedimenticola sp.]
MMKRIIGTMLLLWAVQLNAATLTIEITEGAEGALPIAVVPFGWSGPGASNIGTEISEIVRSDLQRSGRFAALPVKDMLARPQSDADVEFRDWKVLGMDNLVVGQVRPNGQGGFLVRFQL